MSWVTVVWSLLSGLASLVVGIVTGSLSLGGLGAGVLIDVVSSAVLIWRFRRQRAHGAFPEAAERRAQRVAALGLLAIAVALTASAIDHLVSADHPDVSVLAMALAGVNVVVLPVLARWKYAVATRVASRALRTDAHITMVGTATAVLSVVGLAVARAWGWWWADSAAALGIAVIAASQGRRSLPFVAPPDELQA